MSSDVRTKFEAQLPKPSNLSFEKLFNYIAGICSIAGLIGAPFVITDPSSVTYVYLIFLSMLVFGLSIYAIIINHRKLHRYAQAVIFVHYVNHVVRDILQEALNKETDINSITEKLLSAIATCFSIITATKCRASVVEILPDFQLKVASRDSISKALAKKKLGSHYLTDNTDFSDLWYAKNGCSRYYLCNDLLREWKTHKYKNSSFYEVGEPIVSRHLFGDCVTNWQLPYRSTLILPIRYLSKFDPLMV